MDFGNASAEWVVFVFGGLIVFRVLNQTVIAVPTEYFLFAVFGFGKQITTLVVFVMFTQPIFEQIAPSAV